jgi:hypothetical protein
MSDNRRAKVQTTAGKREADCKRSRRQCLSREARLRINVILEPYCDHDGRRKELIDEIESIAIEYPVTCS